MKTRDFHFHGPGLRALREAVALSQWDLGAEMKRIGAPVTGKTIGYWERDGNDPLRTVPNCEQIGFLAEVFSLKPREVWRRLYSKAG